MILVIELIRSTSLKRLSRLTGWSRSPRWLEIASFVLLLGLHGPTGQLGGNSSFATAATAATARDPSHKSTTSPLLHSHNDYERRRPLEDAIAHGMSSVEVDLWRGEGESISVSHTGWIVRGTLESLYLQPLAAILARQGSVRGDGKTFYLWLDLKEDSAELIDRLERALQRYAPLLTHFKPLPDGGIEAPGPVTVILTGSPINKSRYAQRPGIRLASRDSWGVSANDPQGTPLWEWNSLRWSSAFRWTGLGRMPEQERERLRTLVELLRTKRRKLRIYGAPESEAYWREAARAGVDMIGADAIHRLGKLQREWLSDATLSPP